MTTLPIEAVLPELRAKLVAHASVVLQAPPGAGKTTYVPLAYDWDWSGAVNARYARPDPRLQIRSVTERLMRGYCTAPDNYEKVFGLFRAKKDSIYALYHDSLAAPMKEGVVKNTLKYFDDFYEVINNKRLADRFIVKACLESQA